MTSQRLARNPEIVFTLAMLFIMVGLSLTFSLPILIPSGERAAFVGVHYLYPLVGVAIWGIIALVGQRTNLARTFFVALPCYALVQWMHFNIKLWVPHINPLYYDDFYLKVDSAFRPVIQFMFVLSQRLDFLIPADSNFYMVGFIGIFYISFCFHAIRTPENFRTVFLSALFFQGLGTLAYIPFPALGPFLFETGINETMTKSQEGMLAFHRAIISNPPEWLTIHGPANITAALAAMPSLHAGGSFLFWLLAYKYARILLPLYTFLLFFILISAVTTRWHYLIDLPVGMLIAWISVTFAEKLSALPTDDSAARPARGDVALA